VNLVRNGIEAMDEVPDDDRLLTITTGPHRREMVQVEVRDCGKGIRAEDRERVFQPFFTTKPEGMGMGLVISRSIIQGYRGRLWLSATEDPGCTFCFTLPTAKKA
jgi:signal transduction histidine kinase